MSFQIPVRQANQVLRDEIRRIRRPTNLACPRKGQRVALAADTGGTVCHVYVMAVEHQLLGDADYQDARLEGYPNYGYWVDGWVRWRDHEWCVRQLLQRTGAAFEPDDEHPEADRRVMDRFRSRWTQKGSWVLSVVRDPVESSRLLAARSEELYVTSSARALRGEPAAVSEEDQREITRFAGRTFDQWQVLERAARDRDRERWSLGERLDAAVALARREGRSASGDVRVIEKRIRELERRADRRAA